MTTISELPAWLDPNGLRVAGYGLTRHALIQMDERGVSHDQVATALLNPTVHTHPVTEHGRAEYANHNVTVFTNERTKVILAVLWAGEISELAAIKPEPVRGTPRPVKSSYRRRRPRVLPVQRAHVLDEVHPAMRAEITRLVDGDFTRLVVHSPTKVTIKPVE